MGQDITTNAMVPVDEKGNPSEGGTPRSMPVIVNLERVPMELSERTKLLAEAVASGNYRLAEPTTASMLGQLASQVGQVALDYGPSMAAIGYGAAKGTAAGAPLGPLGAAGGGLLGAAMGGIAGRGVTNVGNAIVNQTPMEGVSQTMLQGAQTGLQAQAMGMPLQALQVGLGAAAATTPWVPSGPRAATVAAAKARGIDLTTYETTGSPFFRTMEDITSRSLTGSGQMKRFGERQAEQLIQSGEQTGLQFGPPIDPVARSNRFVTALQGRIGDLKGEANTLFENYVAAAGPKSPVPMDGVYKRAFDIQGNLPLLASLRNSKLTNGSTGILDDIQTLQKQGFKTLPLEEVRKIRTALGDIAYPDRLQGTVIVDAPVAAARRLYGAFTEALELNAAQTGTTPLLQQANQFQKSVIGNLNDSRFYSALIDNEKSLSALSKTIFNPRDPGVLMDAKTVVSPAGWKMLQQQYWDDVFTASTTQSTEGARGFQGMKFADRLEKDQSILKVLYDPDQLKEIMEFGKVARLTSRTSQSAGANAAMGVMVGGGQMIASGHAALNLMQGDIGPAMIGTSAVVAPWFAAKVFTSPTATQMMSKMIQMGKINPNSLAELAKYALRGEAIREHKAESPSTQ